jgi:hypothetical protein
MLWLSIRCEDVDVMVILITTAIDLTKDVIEDYEVCVEACCRVSLLLHILPGVLRSAPCR